MNIEFLISKKKQELVAKCHDGCDDKQKKNCDVTAYYPEYCKPVRDKIERYKEELITNLE